MTRRCVDNDEMLRQRFGRLTVIWEAPAVESSGRLRRMWVCRCDCGTVVEAINQTSLRTGMTRSCGCLAREVASHRMWGRPVTSDEILDAEAVERAAASRQWEAWFGRASEAAAVGA